MERKNDTSKDAPSSLRDQHTPPVPLTPTSFLSSPDSSFVTQNATEPINAAQASDHSLDTAFEQLKLADKAPTPMFRMIGAAFQHATNQDESTDLGVDNWRAHLEHAERLSEGSQIDIQALRLIRSMLDHLWSHRHEDGLVAVANLLADWSRERECDIETRKYPWPWYIV
jgi:hypothetical protein